jgi:DnaK suppressor protein
VLRSTLEQLLTRQAGEARDDEGAIEDALARITRDRFGVCETCGSPISKARLEAVPWTRLSRDCKELEQSAA